MNQISPPPIVNKINYQNCKQINLETGRVYETPQGHSVPSVTTILSATKDMKHLLEWRKRVGNDEATRITKEASGVGTAMHANLERFVLGKQRQPGNNLVHVKANKMADVIIHNALTHVDEIWAIEQSLFYPELYSGTTDMVCVYKGQLSICDYKQSNKLKKEEWIQDYKIQLVAYIMAHNHVYSTDIREGHVFLCTQNLEYQQFDLWPNEYDKYQEQWLDRVETYYKNNN